MCKRKKGNSFTWDGRINALWFYRDTYARENHSNHANYCIWVMAQKNEKSILEKYFSEILSLVNRNVGFD